MLRLTLALSLLYSTVVHAQVPDAAFGTNGIARLALPGNNVQLFDLIVQDDGRIVAAGYLDSIASRHTAVALALQADGAWDAGFVNGGIYRDFTTLTDQKFHRIQRAPDNTGDVYLSGSLQQFNYDYNGLGVARLHADGTPADFGFGGTRVFNVSICDNQQGHGAYVRPNGKVFLFGHGYWGGVTRVCAFASTAANGLNDITFANGTASNTVDLNGSSDYSFDAITDASERFLVVVGQSTSASVIRLDAEGYRDYGYNGDGFYYCGSEAYRIGNWPGGKFVVVGSSEDGTIDGGLVCRLNANGTPDLTFGPEGKRSYAWPDSNTVFTDFAWDTEGRLVLSGHRADMIFGGVKGILVRLLANGDLDPSFGTDGLYHVPHPVEREQCGIALGNDGRIYFTSGSSSSDSAYVSCYTTDVTTTGMPAADRPALRVWPSPAADRLFVAGPADLLPRVFDLTGRALDPPLIRSGTHWIVNVGALRKGTYIVQLGRGAVRFLKE